MPNIALDDLHFESKWSILKGWLNQPHVVRWWGAPEDTLSELRNHPEGAQAIIRLEGEPVGYLCWQSPTPSELTDAGLTHLPSDLIDVDIMIGEPDALGQGVGPEALQLLFSRLGGNGVSTVGVATAKANQRALSAFNKVGLCWFQDFFEDGEAYCYLTKRLTSGTSVD